jgi:hypothetical protein
VTAAEVDPVTLPELVEIRRRGWEAKVRMFDVACDGYHRVVEVLKVNRRPLALGIDTTFWHHWPGGSEHGWRWLPSADGWSPDYRGRELGLWLDVPYEVVSLVTGQPVYNRYTFRCAKRHCSQEIWLPWLREQVVSGQRRRVIITDETRYAMRQMPGG